MYLFAGSVTIAWSFVILFFLPASPLEPGRLFNENEKIILLHRFEENPWGKDRQSFSMPQFVEAILDIKTWIYLLLGASIYVCILVGRFPIHHSLTQDRTRSVTVQ